jgi:tripartite-type tricarboxylate transporter receptor subunit TctC
MIPGLIGNMQRRITLAISITAIAISMGVASTAAHALYPEPSRRITFIVPFAAGGSNDILARAIGQRLSDAWRILVVVENHVGASGALGAAQAAQATPDGYTMLILSSTYTINCAVMPKLPFDPKTSFAPVAMLGKGAMMLAASKTLPVRDAKELIALAREKPGELNYGSAGVGSVNQMAMELLKSIANLDIKHVPYRSGNAAVNDLIGGHLDMFVGSLPQMIEMVRAGTATGIAVTSPRRSAAMPELSTLAEAGVQGYELEQWWGVVVPAGTPRPTIDMLNAELNRILTTPEITAFMAREGAEPNPSTPDDFGRHIATELQRWDDLVARAGLRAE